MISIDAETNSLELVGVSEADLEKRRADWKPLPLKPKSGHLLNLSGTLRMLRTVALPICSRLHIPLCNNTLHEEACIVDPGLKALESEEATASLASHPPPYHIRRISTPHLDRAPPLLQHLRFMHFRLRPTEQRHVLKAQRQRRIPPLQLRSTETVEGGTMLLPLNTSSNRYAISFTLNGM